MHVSILDGVRRASHSYSLTRAWSARGHRGSVLGGTQSSQATSPPHEMSQTGMKTNPEPVLVLVSFSPVPSVLVQECRVRAN